MGRMVSRKRTILCFVVSVGFAVGLFSAQAEAGFIAIPMEMHFETRAGGNETQAIQIRNRGKDPLRLKISLADYRVGPDLKETEEKPGTFRAGCSEWIALSHREMELGPQQTENLRVTLRVPAGSVGSYWSKVYIEQTSKPTPRRHVKDERVYQVFVMQRVGVRVFEDVPGTAHLDAAISSVTVDMKEQDSPSNISVTVQNKGNSILRCDGSVEIRDETGKTLDTIKLGNKGKFSVYPYGERVLNVPVNVPLPPRLYSALAIVDFGAEHLVAGEAVFRVNAASDAGKTTTGKKPVKGSHEGEDRKKP